MRCDGYSGTKEARSAREGASNLRVVTAAAVLALLTLGICFPGEMTPDAARQLAEARTGKFTDWHPPIMAMLWSVAPYPAAMLTLQIGLHWIGIAGLALRLSGHWRWVMLAVGLTPIAFKYLGVLQKDTLLTSLFVAAFGLAAHFRIASIALGLFGSLVRANGVFAFGPLALPRMGLVRTIALSVALSAALIPVSMAFNRLVSEPTGVERSVQAYDLAGIEQFSGKPSGCYTPLFWDTLSTERCGFSYQKIRGSITGEWLNAIANHPLAYAQHRLMHFNSTTFFLVPAMQQCVEAPEMHECDQSLLTDALTKNPLLWPVTWLAVGLLLLFAKPDPFARNLCLSGLLYGFAYLLVGVASDFRYFYWTELAVQAAIVLHLAEGGRVPIKPLALVIGAVWVAGYVARYG